MTNREAAKTQFSAQLREDLKEARKCVKGKPCGGRCIPQNWNCRLKGEGDTPPTRGNLATLSPELKNKIAARRRNETFSTIAKLALTAGGAAAAGAVLNKRGVSPREVTQGAATAAGLVSAFNPAISGPVTLAAVAAGAGAGLANNAAKGERFKSRVAGIAASAVKTRKIIARRRTELAADRKAFNDLQEKIKNATDEKQRRRLIAESKVRLQSIGKNEQKIKDLSESLPGRERLVSKARNKSRVTFSKLIRAATKGANETSRQARSIRSQSIKNRSAFGLTSLGKPGAKVQFSDWRANPRNTQDSAERTDVVFENKELHARVKAEAKRKFKVYPSAYANAWMVKEYKKRGGTFRNDDLKKWFNEKWVRMSAKGEILGPCGDREKGEGKPRCLPEAKARALSKKERAKTVRAKRKADPKKNRSGAAKMVPNTFDSEGKKYSKTVVNPETGRKKTVKYGAKGYRIAPGTKRGNSYCARSFGDMKSHGKDCSGKDRNTPLCLSRAKWKCSGKSSRKDAGEKRLGKPCGASYISKSKECRIQKGSGWNKVAAVAGIAAVAAGGYALSQRNPDRDRKPRLSPAERNAARLARQDRMSEEKAKKITDEAIAGGKVWDVQEKINKRRKAEIDAQCGGGLGKIQTPAKFDAMVREPRCQVGEGAYGTYFVHTSGKYGVKVFRNGDEDDVEKEFDLLDRARSAGVNVPRPLAQNAVLDQDGYTKSQTLVLEHMRGYKEAAKLYPSGGYDLSKAPLIVQVKALREFRKLNVEGLAHGDIHGGNILVNPRSKKVALIDFGYATAIDDVAHPQHGRDGVQTLMSDLRNVRSFLGVNTEFLEEKSHPILQNIRRNAENYDRDWDKFEVSVKRYYDFVETELLYGERKPRSRFVRSVEQLRIPDLTRRILTANRDPQQRRMMVQLMNEEPRKAEVMAKNIGVKRQRLFLALKPEREQLAARIKEQPFGTPL